VIPTPDPEYGTVPKVVAVLRDGAHATPAELLAHVAERVATDTKVRRVEIGSAIPRSSAGMILGRVLVEADRARVSGP
jgi:acyl-CoA synthetase (AMP-forming)/AMP-acid ligase II